MTASAGVSLPRRTVFETSEAELLGQYLRDAYGSNLRTSVVKAEACRHVRTDAGDFAVDEMRLPASFSYSAELPDIIIAESRGGELERRLGQESDRVVAGDVLIFTQPGLDYRGECHGFDARTTTLTTATLALVAGEPVRFTDYRPLSQATAQLWKRTVDYLSQDLLDVPEAAAQPLLRDNAARLLAATALSVFPNNVMHDTRCETAADHPAAASALLRRARAFIDDNAHRDIGLSDIAAAVHVTPRALQYAFRRHLDTTPTAYLRRVRLNHAHAALKAATPASGETVTTVAARWGFLNPGRFAAVYRLAYGRSPSHTLKSW
ncbi:helix-turn-helix domain-containing protein [Streptomyces tsukubensis]|uniref:HTH araC/xylS-type domain-containing protein n=1 Tax=Streptomyces tsukubensis TaxID=83656 RepID=A0A1V4A5T9_9ACTN|nr:helix-turn-helix domain-containing protein [Streptomyces tsukubensis]OON76994.1 hypothetical protein B1H18_19825 [Streptomyces tsukubensis]